MGVDCNIRLPENVSVRGVADAIGKLAGLMSRMEKLPWGTPCQVDGVSVSNGGNIAGLAHIVIRGELIGGRTVCEVLYHFEPSFDGRLLMPRSTPLWLAIGTGLVDFFGGSIDYCDCDQSEIDYEMPARSREENSPDDDGPWDKFQARLHALQPITVADLAKFEKIAAYPESEQRS